LAKTYTTIHIDIRLNDSISRLVANWTDMQVLEMIETPKVVYPQIFEN